MYPSTPMQYNKYKTILEQVSHPQEATVNARNETTKSTTTLDYYNKNAKKFITGTISVDFGIVQNRFLDKLHPGAEILDYGCGSGRDTKYFLEQGCKVTAIDGSQELCNQCPKPCMIYVYGRIQLMKQGTIFAVLIFG